MINEGSKRLNVIFDLKEFQNDSFVIWVPLQLLEGELDEPNSYAELESALGSTLREVEVACKPLMISCLASDEENLEAARKIMWMASTSERVRAFSLKPKVPTLQSALTLFSTSKDEIGPCEALALCFAIDELSAIIMDGSIKEAMLDSLLPGSIVIDSLSADQLDTFLGKLWVDFDPSTQQLLFDF